MRHTLIVHEDGEPFVRHKTFKRLDELKLMIARTHNSLLDGGYALISTREKEQQRAMTYAYVKLRDEKRHKVYLVVSIE